MSISFEISTILPATPDAVYAAWLDSAQHSAMTGGAAMITPKVGESFSAWDGYIFGTNEALEEGKRIVQTWRTIEFTEEEPDSHLEIELEAHEKGSLLTLHHSNLPPHGTQYEQGWIDNYFEPMTRFFQG